MTKTWNFLNRNFGDQREVTPYWITLDGTKVYSKTYKKTVNEAYTRETGTIELGRKATREAVSGMTAQAGCVVGDYYYQAYSGSEGVKIARWIIEQEEKMVSDILDIGNASDMTYNANTGLLVIANGEKQIYFVDPDSFTIVNSATLKVDGKTISWEANDIIASVPQAEDTNLTLLHEVILITTQVTQKAVPWNLSESTLLLKTLTFWVGLQKLQKTVNCKS